MDWMRAHRFLACSGYKEDQHIPLSASSKLDYHLTAVHWMRRFLYKAHYSLSVTHLTIPAVVYWGYTRVYAVYQPPGFFDSIYSLVSGVGC